MEKQFEPPVFKRTEIRKDENLQASIDSESENQTVLRTNLKATHKRHLRVFGTSSYSGILFMKTKKFIKGAAHFIYTKFKRTSRRLVVSSDHVVVRDPFKTFVRQTVAIACSLFVITSLPPARILETGFTADYFADTDFIDETAESELGLPAFIINEEGFVLKTSPVTEEVSRIGYNEMLKHTVVSGDTLSGIAQLYGLSVKTILWENKLNADSTLKIGQTLSIPAVDGVAHVAEKGDTLESIAKKYEVEVALIKTHNNLEADVITPGEKLFIPGGKLQSAPVIVRTGISGQSGASIGGRTVARTQTYSGELATSAVCGKFLFPTIGKVTQGFRSGHYALDIGNVNKPDVWAACGGTVVKVVSGCPIREVRVDRGCGGGYGNHIVIDHGGKTQTLYAHLEAVYVSVGESVAAGQAIGKMGNTGRAYGATGRHLHVELYMSGQKKNLANYM